jgi:hypothetical protein
MKTEVVVTDTIRDAIIALQNGESTQFKDVISTSLMNKAMDAINLQKITAGQAMFDEPEEIEVDDTDLEQEEVSDEEV